MLLVMCMLSYAFIKNLLFWHYKQTLFLFVLMYDINVQIFFKDNSQGASLFRKLSMVFNNQHCSGRVTTALPNSVESCTALGL